MLRYTTDRARPGLVSMYDIRPGNGAGQFLQPWSPHGAKDEDRRKRRTRRGGGEQGGGGGKGVSLFPHGTQD